MTPEETDMIPQAVLCLAGLSGSGKSSVCEWLTANGIVTLYTADVGRKWMGDNSDRFSYGDAYLETHGFIARVFDFMLQNARFENQTVVVDSLRSLNEWRFVQSILPDRAFLVAVVCGDKERVSRLKRREGAKLEQIRQRDARELGQLEGSRFNVGQLVALADFVVNNSFNAEPISQQLKPILSEVESAAADRNNNILTSAV